VSLKAVPAAFAVALGPGSVCRRGWRFFHEAVCGFNLGADSGVLWGVLTSFVYVCVVWVRPGVLSSALAATC
jgi:hypothetical protein